MIAIIHLLLNSLMIGTSCIGVITIVNKIGKFCKIIDDNKKDGFKLGFDALMLDSVDEINKCVESLSTITNNLNKITFILYDITVGNKFIKKDKDGKIIICNKSKVVNEYKNKIGELSTKVKKYQEELNKIKSNKKNNSNTDDNGSTNSNESSDNDSTYSGVSDDSDDLILDEKSINEQLEIIEEIENEISMSEENSDENTSESDDKKNRKESLKKKKE